MPVSEQLLAAAKAVAVMDAAGRIAADPDRQASRASAAEVLALAWAAEGLNAIVIEAELLVRALELPTFGDPERADLRDLAIQTQITILKNQLATLRAPSPAKE